MMNSIYNYYNKRYTQLGAFERERIDYIILLNVALLFMFFCVLVLHIFSHVDLLHFSADIVGILGIVSALKMLKKGNINGSSRLLVATLIALDFIYSVLIDYYAAGEIHYLKIYVSLFNILGIYLIMLTLYSSARANFKIYSFIFSLLLIIHMGVIIDHNGGLNHVKSEVISNFIIAMLATIISGQVCSNMSRINNRIFADNIEKSNKLLVYNTNLNEIVDKQTKELRESNDRLKKYAQVTSHDIKEPIRTISNYISLIKMKFSKRYPEDETLDEYFALIMDNSKRINKLINDILVFAKQSKSDEDFTTIDLNNLLVEVSKHLHAVIESKHAVIQYANLCSIYGQENLMFQIFLNLISNSIRYSTPGKNPLIQIESKRSDGYLIIQLKDNGIGIPKAIQEKIFMPYVQSTSSTEGLGMGLAVCKNIIEFHKGELWVESNVGEGSSFFIKVPDEQQSPSIDLQSYTSNSLKAAV